MKRPRYPAALARVSGPSDGSSRMASNIAMEAGSFLRAAAKVSARRMSFCREAGLYHSFMRASDHFASRSLWHRLQAFGIP